MVGSVRETKEYVTVMLEPHRDILQLKGRRRGRRWMIFMPMGQSCGTLDAARYSRWAADVLTRPGRSSDIALSNSLGLFLDRNDAKVSSKLLPPSTSPATRLDKNTALLAARTRPSAGDRVERLLLAWPRAHCASCLDSRIKRHTIYWHVVNCARSTRSLRVQRRRRGVVELD